MMSNTEFPDPIAQEIQGYRRHELSRRQAPSTVVMLSKPGRPSLVLKIAPGLVPEERRLRWLKDKLPVPEVVATASQDGTDYLLMTRLPGVDGSDDRVHRDGGRFVELLAEALRTVHAVPTADCPFSATVDSLLEIAEQRVSQGVLETSDFPAHYLGRSPRELLQALHELRLSDEGAVFTHGDASLPNVLFHRGQVSGFIDLGLAGIADPYRDLGLAARSLTRNMGGKWVRPFLEAYGAPMDERRIEFFILLDVFVGAPPG
jgi:aminoglycoside phosphotransferase